MQIPTYKRTRWLGRTIESALGQTFSDIVVEVHDDATPDDSVAEVVARFDDPRLVLVRHEQNAGIVGNFTRSLLGASTEYVIQLGDDDVAEPRLVEATVAALDAHPRAGVAHSRFSLIDAAGETLVAEQDWLVTPSPPLEEGVAFVEKSMLHGCRVCSSTALIRRSAVPEGGFLQVGLPAVRLRLLAADGRALGRRVRERGPVPATGFTSRATRRRSAMSPAPAICRPSGRCARCTPSSAATRRRSPPGPRRTALERAADRALRQDIISRVRERTLPDRPFKATVRGLADATRREPALLRERNAWALLAGSVLGAGAVERLKGRA